MTRTRNLRIAYLSGPVDARGVYKPTVPDLANDLKIGTVDVAILFDATVRQYPELEAIRGKKRLICREN